MSDEAMRPDEGSRPQVNPLLRRAGRTGLGRVLAAGTVGAFVTASSLLGAGTASAAGSLVIDKCAGTTESSEYGQAILASPNALDAKVRQGTLLVFPFGFDIADQAVQEFKNTGAISLGTVTEEKQKFSGKALAQEFTPRIDGLAALQGRGAEVSKHVRNLAALGCFGASVTGHEKPAPPPPAPEPEPSEQPAPPSHTAPAPPSTGVRPAPGTTAPGVPGYSTGAPVLVAPPGYASGAPGLPGQLPPWAQAQFGAAPGFSPNIGDLREQAAAQERVRAEQAAREEVRAAGKAEALPMSQGDRVALPVLIAAISLAGVTAALVRTWVLRRA
ncbi:MULTISPECIES: hypothetical protein [unclassified Saccharopolyspora]|uniref:hypothetical protein n=1 Tax=unclassified Saccharopolyspora TaxID=2646250 RepID=UPI001CD7502B|nr:MULTISPECIES: hypothetical protein [unclassified Saccharopolyspora]MCA1189838.1 hypothetical protein [Saccharopolyspora sp. 6T]MCA1283192.1 hypothetical protein [Saccharopolyspora sp. 7B]